MELDLVDANPTVAVLTIQLNDSENEQLEIKYFDNPKRLAKAFCERKGLDSEIAVLLEKNIWNDQQLAIQELLSNLPILQQDFDTKQPHFVQDTNTIASITMTSIVPTHTEMQNFISFKAADQFFNECDETSVAILANTSAISTQPHQKLQPPPLHQTTSLSMIKVAPPNVLPKQEERKQMQQVNHSNANAQVTSISPKLTPWDAMRRDMKERKIGTSSSTLSTQLSDISWVSQYGRNIDNKENVGLTTHSQIINTDGCQRIETYHAGSRRSSREGMKPSSSGLATQQIVPMSISVAKSKKSVEDSQPQMRRSHSNLGMSSFKEITSLKDHRNSKLHPQKQNFQQHEKNFDQPKPSREQIFDQRQPQQQYRRTMNHQRSASTGNSDILEISRLNLELESQSSFTGRGDILLQSARNEVKQYKQQQVNQQPNNEYAMFNRKSIEFINHPEFLQEIKTKNNLHYQNLAKHSISPQQSNQQVYPSRYDISCGYQMKTQADQATTMTPTLSRSHIPINGQRHSVSNLRVSPKNVIASSSRQNIARNAQNQSSNSVVASSADQLQSIQHSKQSRQQNSCSSYSNSSEANFNRTSLSRSPASHRSNANLGLLPNKIGMNANSRKIIEKSEDKALADIFRTLDSDNDGVISASKIAVTALNPWVLNVISPVLYEMEDFSFTLTFSEFRDAVMCMLSSISAFSRGEFFNQLKKIPHSIRGGGSSEMIR